ncbi:MAG: NUDIX hydrolase [Candidatus Merdivicinus sp.]|jgi:8-oxo-dGTP diphosphatase
MAEFWDIYDKNRQKTGRIQERGKPMDPDDYHLVVEIWLQNTKGEVLLTRRHPDKHYGGLWECTGGSAVAGEESLTAAMREMREEIGVDLTDGEPGKHLASFTIRRDAPGHYSAHYDVYLFRRDIPLESLHLQAEEVTDAQWVDEATFQKMQQNGELIPCKLNPFQWGKFKE